MIIDITNSNLINIKEGDMIYSRSKDEVSLVLEIKSVKDMSKGDCVHIFTNTELTYLVGFLGNSFFYRTFRRFRFF